MRLSSWISSKALATVLVLATCLAVALAPSPAIAGNGHFLYGVGAVQSSMGGVGAGLPTDVLGALFLNPAMLSELDEGHQMVFGIEMVQSDSTVTSTVTTPFGPFTGSTEGESDLAPIPAVGWSYRPEGSRIAFGFGVLGLAGFATDYPADPTNPVLAPQPAGVGRVQADYTLLQIPFAISWQVRDNLSLGFQINGGWATLEATPLPVLGPDCSSPTDCFFPGVNKDGAFGYGFQLGIYYEPNEKLGLGFGYISEQTYEDFSWNVSRVNPNRPDFGLSRRARFNVDSPQIVAAGIGFRPNSQWSFGLDARLISYSSTDGFRTGPIDPMTGTSPGLGWDDIWVFGIGGQYEFPNGVTLRAGYNLSDAAVQPETAFFNVQSPANFEDHYSVGLGFPLYESLDVHVGYYHVPENAVGGPFQSPFGPVPGTNLVNEISVDSYQFAFSFKP